MERKLSLGSRRRSSKASRDGSLSENIANADIRASSRGISTSPDRGSGREPKRERIRPKRESAERFLRASPRARAMGGHSVSPSVKTGSSGKHYARRHCEMGDENKRLFKGKTHGREFLVTRPILAIDLVHQIPQLVGGP